VIAYEPDEQNLELLARNAAGLDISVLPYALTDDEAMVAQGTAEFWLNVKNHMGMHSLVHSRGREAVEVPVRSFRGELEQNNPSRLKVDIEGGEWMLDWDDLPKRVVGLHVEMHMQKKGFRTKAKSLHNLIVSQGFRTVTAPNFAKRYGTHPVYRRD